MPQYAVRLCAFVVLASGCRQAAGAPLPVEFSSGDLNALTNDGPAPPEEKAQVVYGRPSKFKNIGHAAPVGAASRPCGRYAPQGSPCHASVEIDDKLTGGGGSHEAAVRKKADEEASHCFWCR